MLDELLLSFFTVLDCYKSFFLTNLSSLKSDAGGEEEIQVCLLLTALPSHLVRNPPNEH